MSVCGVCDVLDWGVIAELIKPFVFVAECRLMHSYMPSLGSVVLGRALF